MALHFLLGSSGSGKSTCIYKTITDRAVEASAHGLRGMTDFLLIVPEQFTLQTQRDIIAAHPSGGIFNIDVLSFPRLAHRIFEELGITQQTVLEDTGKSMIVKKVALEHRDELTCYAGKVRQQGFIDEMKSIIAEFYQYGIDSERLEMMKKLAEGRHLLSSKLHDIEVIYNGFKAFIDGRFVMNEEVLDRLCLEAEHSELLKRSVVCFDGFTGFTVSQLEVIRALMPLVRDMYITLTIDEREVGRPLNEEALFYLSYKTHTACARIADEFGIPVIDHLMSETTGTTPVRLAHRPALAALEHNLFRYPMVRSNETDGITLMSTSGPSAEIAMCISEIRRLVAFEGYRYSDIAILSGDPSLYSGIAEREFTKADIPFFADEKHNIVGTAPVELLRAVVDIARSNYTFDSVFRFIKSGLTDISAEDGCTLENYCLTCGIKGSHMWEKDWTTTYTGRYKSRYKADLEHIETLRRTVFGLLKERVEVLRSDTATVDERIGVLRSLLEECGVKEALEAKADSLRMSDDEQDRAAAKESEQLYEAVEKVFERISMLLGSDIITPKEFAEILDTGFKEAKLALIPQGADSVVIGDVERTRLNPVRALFLIGVNDGILPKGGSEKSILSDSDRTIFAEHDIELSPTGRQSTYLGEFYMYLALTRASERLYVSWHRMKSDKKPGRPAYVFHKLERMFPELAVRNLGSEETGSAIGADGGRGRLAAILRDRSADELSAEERALIKLLAESDSRLYAQICDAAFYYPGADRIRPENAKDLYHGVLVGSVTMLEKYASCAFAHFLQYGLRLDEREEYHIGLPELGTIYHEALELYTRKLEERGIRWHDTDKALRDEIRIESTAEALGKFGDLLTSSKRSEYISKSVEKVLSRTVEVLDEQVKAGDFEPAYSEKAFRYAESFMTLRGQIDRMDICDKDGKKYLRIIDYKSGQKSFLLRDLFYGLQIQLGVYLREGMRIVEENTGVKAQPSGVYYYHIADPIIKLKKGKTAEDSDFLQALRLSGPTWDSPASLKAQDRELYTEDGSLRGGYKSKVISVETTKDCEFKSCTKLWDKGNFESVIGYLEESMAQKGDEILAGEASVNPYMLGEHDACRHCGYRNVCGFEPGLGSCYRELKEYSEDEIWEKISGATNSSMS